MRVTRDCKANELAVFGDDDHTAAAAAAAAHDGDDDAAAVECGSDSDGMEGS